MAKAWSFGDIVARTSHIVNFNDGQTDQDFSAQNIKDAINESYVDEVTEAVQRGAPSQWLHQTDTATWPAGQLNLTILDRQLIELRDVTGGEPGFTLWVGNRDEGTSIVLKSHDTLQWSPSGPPSALTVRYIYVAEPQEMTEDDDIPILVPRVNRHLLCWSAAITLLTIADQEPPKAWLRKRDELREAFWKTLSMGRPMVGGYPGVRSTSSDYVEPAW